MDWQKELVARLADHPRMEWKKSRLVPGMAFFFRGKEAVNFTGPGTVNIRMGAALLYAIKKLTAEECVKEVSKDGIVLRLESAEDLEFAGTILERLFQEKVGERRPEGKNTRKGGWSAKRKANSALDDAQALRALKDLKADSEE